MNISALVDAVEEEAAAVAGAGADAGVFDVAPAAVACTGALAFEGTETAGTNAPTPTTEEEGLEVAGWLLSEVFVGVFVGLGS